MMDGLVEIYLPDLKYKDAALSKAYSGAADYFDVAQAAIQRCTGRRGLCNGGQTAFCKGG